MRVAIGRIDENPFQPRRHFDEDGIVELARSLKADGLMQPLVVAKRGRRFLLIAGERRLRAARHLGWSHIEVRVVVADDERLRTLALVENLQRRDLSDVERGRALKALKEAESLTWAQVAERVGLGRRRVLQLVKLLDAPEDVLAMVERGEASERRVRELVREGVASDELAGRLAAEGEPRCTLAPAWERPLRRLERALEMAKGEDREMLVSHLQAVLERA
jgi:ParB family chromosome partitioning protein